MKHVIFIVLLCTSVVTITFDKYDNIKNCKYIFNIITVINGV